MVETLGFSAAVSLHKRQQLHAFSDIAWIFIQVLDADFTLPSEALSIRPCSEE